MQVKALLNATRLTKEKTEKREYIEKALKVSEETNIKPEEALCKTYLVEYEDNIDVVEKLV